MFCRLFWPVWVSEALQVMAYQYKQLSEGYIQWAVAIPKLRSGEISKTLAKLLPAPPQVPMTSLAVNILITKSSFIPSPKPSSLTPSPNLLSSYLLPVQLSLSQALDSLCHLWYSIWVLNMVWRELRFLLAVEEIMLAIGISGQASFSNLTK